MRPFQRIFLMVMDSVGIGAMPDADQFDDRGANTLGHIAEHMNGLDMPHMAKLGLGNIEPLKGIQPVASPVSHFGKMKEASMGKDTTTGHWEIMGLRIEKPFKTWPNGFPDTLIKPLEQRTGRKVIGNKPASGTEIIKELGEKHIKTGDIIVYTSADSVLQIAAHEEVIPLDELYRICEIARELTLDPEHAVVRVIARPFVGTPGQFERTPNRKDFSISPPAPTVMNRLVDQGYDSIAIGKISDIYNGEGVSQSIKTTSNMDGVDRFIETMRQDFTGLSFVNLVDFDAKYGHRRNPKGYGEALQELDRRIPELLDALQNEDLLIITADHGNDPTHHGTDHTREYVPLLVYHNHIREAVNLGVRDTFSDVGATIADNFDVDRPPYGTSFLHEIT
ncbi:MAG: phosphopentomutase [Bacillaceae bacterium]|nr:phosphopentomutase [Bacillaceae bacterium]